MPQPRSKISRRDALGAITGLVASISGCSTVSSSDSISCEPIPSTWPTSGANSERTGVVTNAQLPPADANVMEILSNEEQVAGGIRSAPVIGNGTIFSTSETGHVIARGDTEWTVTTDTQAGVTPVLDCGLVYAHIASGVLALDSKDGREVWRREGDPVSLDISNPTPALSGGLLILGTSEVVALDKMTGKTKWRRDNNKEMSITGIAANSDYIVTVSVQDDTSYLTCYDTVGNHQWSRQIENNHEPPRPTIANGQVYALTDTGKLYSITIPTGEVLWETTVDEDLDSGLAANAENIFVPSGDAGTLRALNTNSGDIRWTKQVGATAGPPAIVDDHLLTAVQSIPGVRNTTGFVSFNPKNGNILRRYPTGRVGPFAVGNGYLAFYHNYSLWQLS